MINLKDSNHKFIMTKYVSFVLNVYKCEFCNMELGLYKHEFNSQLILNDAIGYKSLKRMLDKTCSEYIMQQILE